MTPPCPRRAKSDTLDRTFHIPKLDPIADAKRSIEKNRNGTKEIADRILGRKGQRDTTNAQGPYRGLPLFAHPLRNQHDADHDHKQPKNLAEHRNQHIVKAG